MRIITHDPRIFEMAKDGDEVASDDKGSLFITREKDETVTIIVRAPHTTHEAKITIPWGDWIKLREVSLTTIPRLWEGWPTDRSQPR